VPMGLALSAFVAVILLFTPWASRTLVSRRRVGGA
jgi:hypothetical protein